MGPILPDPQGRAAQPTDHRLSTPHSVSFRKPSRNETSRKHTCTQPETRTGDPLTSPRAPTPLETTVTLAAASVDTGDTAWLLAATALVLLMTPGLALFYGGMVRTKSVLNMLMMSFVSIALVTAVWLAAGYPLGVGGDIGGGLIGSPAHAGMAGLGPDSVHGTVPTLLFATFQLTFAIITAALISGAIADRVKFGAWLVFVPVWAL